MNLALTAFIVLAAPIDVYEMANENVSRLLSIRSFITHKMTMMSGNRRAIRVTNDYVY